MMRPVVEQQVEWFDIEVGEGRMAHSLSEGDLTCICPFLFMSHITNLNMCAVRRQFNEMGFKASTEVDVR